MQKSVNLNWQNSSVEIKEQRVYRSINGSEFELIGTTDPLTRSYTDPIDSVSSGSTITYRIDSVASVRDINYTASGMETVLFKPYEDIPAGYQGLTAGPNLHLMSLSDMDVVIEGVVVNKSFDETTGWYTYTADMPDENARPISLNAVNEGELLNDVTFISGLGRLGEWFGPFVPNATIALGESITNVPAQLEPSITSLQNMFQNSSELNDPDISGWDVSNVVNFAHMFSGATAFDQDISTWNVSKVTDMSGMFESTTYLNRHSLADWCVSNITTAPEGFAGDATTPDNYPVWGTCPATINALMFTSSGEEIVFEGQTGDELHYPDGTVEPVLGDGTFTKFLPAGNYTVIPASTRSLGSMAIGGIGLTHVIQFPNDPMINHVKFNTSAGGAYSLIGVPSYLPPNLTNLSSMFQGCSVINDPNISGWDVSNVDNFANMFLEAIAFNQPLDTWNTSNVVDMQNMFMVAEAFNQDISTWDVSNVTNMEGLFAGTKAFNQPLDNWNVSNVTSMRWVFQGTVSFNQPLNSWDVSKVEVMSQMFERAEAFNQPLDNWNVSNVTDMVGMFSRAVSFSQNLSQWCVSNIPETPTYVFGYITIPEEYKPVWGTCPRGENGV